MKLSDLNTMDRRSEEGVWISEPLGLKGVRLLVRPSSNSDYRREVARQYNKVSASDRNDPDVQERLQTEVYIENQLIGWDGIEDLPYSKDAARELLTSNHLFRQAVAVATTLAAEQLAESIEADVKNSGTSSTGL